VPVFVRRLPPSWRRLWDQPAVFAVAFAVGFALAFAAGAAVLWRAPAPERLLEEGRADQLLALLPAQNPTPTEALWRGHASALKGRRDDMLAAYAVALASGVADGRALDNVIEALGTAKLRASAVQLLATWTSDALDERLSTVAGDANHERRHGAVDVLNARSTATVERRLRAAVLAAVTDAQSGVCAEKIEGVGALAAFVELPRAHKDLRELQAWKVVYDQNNGRVLDECRSLDPALLKQTETALGAVERQ
jgi:hypothetical protein